MAFGGKNWSIIPREMNLGPVSDGSATCVGGITRAGTSKTWIVGGPFLKSVYSVFRFQPPELGFAELSIQAGGTAGECYSLTLLLYWKHALPGLPRNGNGSESTNDGDDTNNDDGTNNGDDTNNGDNTSGGTGGEQPVPRHASGADTDKTASLSQL